MKILLARVALFAALVGVASAAPLSQNLGHGLAFYRVHQLATDLPGIDEPRRPCVLDLRYVTADGDEAATLAAWLKSHATARTPVFLLANASTSAALLSVVSPRGASVIVFGAGTDQFSPDITIKTSAEAERRVYDALEHGASAGSLIAENPDKPRNDEARLARERQTQADYVAAPEDPATPVSAIANETAKSKPPAPLVDLVLQRAVQTHRALIALKKL